VLFRSEADLIIKYWYSRLFYKPANKKANAAKNIFTALLIILTWIPIRIMVGMYYGLDEDNYLLVRAIPVICSITLSLFFLFDSRKIKNIIFSILPNIAIYLYFFLLPNNEDSQSLDNAFYFMFVLLWFFVLFAQSNCNIKKLDYSGFLEKTVEIIFLSKIFIIGGIVIVALSVSLFNAIEVYSAASFYYKNIVTLGLTACPCVSLLVIDAVNRVKLSVIIANIFLPIILVSIIGFALVSIFTGSKPYDDRDIFVVYNVMMVIVICVLTFTGANTINNKIINICFYILPIATMILDIITISAVIYRLNEYGITANKTTLLGTNIVMLGHLICITYSKIKQKTAQSTVYLPMYFVWAFCVVFILPFVFKMA
jgi:hypothetical protein